MRFWAHMPVSTKGRDMDFQLVQEVKVVFGAGKAATLPEVLAEKAASHPLIVTDRGIVAAGIAAKVCAELESAGIAYSLFDGVEPDPSASVVEAAWNLHQAENCDLVIGLGGGSAMDTAKAVNILRYNKGPILRYAKGETIVSSPGLVVIPTTSGTGSELSDGLVVSGDDGEKHPILATLASSEYAIVDPELMVGMPPHITASTGFDALAHNVEAYTGTAATLITDQITTSTIDKICAWLPRAVANGSDLEARSHMAVACLMGGWMLRYGHTHAGHSVAHILGGHFHIPHGFACAYALPLVLEFNALVIPEKTIDVARRFGANITGLETPEEIGRKARMALESFRDNDLHMRPAREWEYDEAEFDEMAQEISTELFQAFNPRKMEAADARHILEEIFA